MKEFKNLSFLFLFSVVIVYSSCKKDQENRVPSVPVDIEIFLNNPSYIDLTVVGGWAYITGGSQGIIVYRSGPEEFIALDRHCSFETENNDRVFVEGSNIIVSDTLNCGSSFVLTDGSVTQGPATFPLTQYQTNYNGTVNKLRIFN